MICRGHKKISRKRILPLDNNTKQVPILSEYDEKTTAGEVISGIDLMGKTAVVTGGYAGMGLVITKALANAGATVIVPARNVPKAEAARRGVPNVEIDSMDLMPPPPWTLLRSVLYKAAGPCTFSSTMPAL